MRELLSPTNDYVFKRVFVEAPQLLVALINDLRPDPPDITSVEILCVPGGWRTVAPGVGSR